MCTRLTNPCPQRPQWTATVLTSGTGWRRLLISLRMAATRIRGVADCPDLAGSLSPWFDLVIAWLPLQGPCLLPVGQIGKRTWPIRVYSVGPLSPHHGEHVIASLAPAAARAARRMSPRVVCDAFARIAETITCRVDLGSTSVSTVSAPCSRSVFQA